MDAPQPKAQQWIVAVLAAALLAAAALVGVPGEVRAQAAGATTYRDWTVNCHTQPETGVEVCEMSQAIFADETRTRTVLQVVVGYTQAGGEPVMLLVLPLGISLPAGVFLQIDQGEPQPIPVERCEADGCRIQLLLAPAYLDALKTGSQATVYAHDRQRRRFAMTFSLLGFTAGMNALAVN